jgi:hypothetical protein
MSTRELGRRKYRWRFQLIEKHRPVAVIGNDTLSFVAAAR